MKRNKWKMFVRWSRIIGVGFGVGYFLFYIALIPVVLVNPDANPSFWWIFISWIPGMLFVNAFYDAMFN